jgi:hypothetical protein
MVATSEKDRQRDQTSGATLIVDIFSHEHP